jgi:IPTL-CTERM motif
VAPVPRIGAAVLRLQPPRPQNWLSLRISDYNDWVIARKGSHNNFSSGDFMKRVIVLSVFACASLLSAVVGAQTLYAASGSNGINGSLYRINPTNAAATLVGPIRIGGAPIGLTGLAQSPTNGLMYGITTADGPNPEGALVIVDPFTGNATLVGSLGAATGSDISFNSAGVLYVWLGNPRQLATVNLTTGLATPVGASGLASNKGGALAFSPGGTLYLSAAGSSGALDTLSTATGVATVGPTMSGAPTADAIDAMAFSPSGTLYGINTNRSGSPTTDFLVTINTTTGVVTSVGALPGDMDALAFGPVVGPVPTLSQWSMIGLGLMLAVFGVIAIRTMRTGRAR